MGCGTRRGNRIGRRGRARRCSARIVRTGLRRLRTPRTRQCFIREGLSDRRAAVLSRRWLIGQRGRSRDGRLHHTRSRGGILPATAGMIPCTRRCGGVAFGPSRIVARDRWSHPAGLGGGQIIQCLGDGILVGTRSWRMSQRLLAMLPRLRGRIGSLRGRIRCLCRNRWEMLRRWRCMSRPRRGLPCPLGIRLVLRLQWLCPMGCRCRRGVGNGRIDGQSTATGSTLSPCGMAWGGIRLDFHTVSR